MDHVPSGWYLWTLAALFFLRAGKMRPEKGERLKEYAL